jgi:hypothetical protein
MQNRFAASTTSTDAEFERRVEIGICEMMRKFAPPAATRGVMHSRATSAGLTHGLPLAPSGAQAAELAARPLRQRRLDHCSRREFLIGSQAASPAAVSARARRRSDGPIRARNLSTLGDQSLLLLRIGDFKNFDRLLDRGCCIRRLDASDRRGRRRAKDEDIPAICFVAIERCTSGRATGLRRPKA